MKFIASVIAAAVCAVWSYAAGANVGEALRSPTDIKNLAQVISDTNSTYSSLIFRASFMSQTNISMKYYLFYKRPDQCALLILDGRDSTPLLIGTQKDALFYDLSSGKLLHTLATGILFTLETDETGFIQFKYGVKGHFFHNRFQTDSGTPVFENNIRIDVPSLLRTISVDIQSTPMPKGQYEWSGYTKKKSLCVAIVDPAAAIPFQSLKLFLQGMTNAFLAFDHIEANTRIDNSIFSLPLDKLRKRKVNVDNNGDRDAIADCGAAALARVTFLRSALAFPGRRSDAARFGLTNVDWNAIGQMDNEVSPILRELFSVNDLASQNAEPTNAPYSSSATDSKR
ncbi:MAG: hypothetical protein WC381_11530 [Kiritimatiellia bacterium]|jgi:hypothetical protein